jgi:hypothetical protein
VRIPVSGPSFLGLGDERSRDLDYLLEDEAPRGHARLYLALLLLVLSAGLLAWHWQRDGYPWAGLVAKPTVASNPAPAPSLTSPNSAAAAAPSVPVEPTANPAPPEAQPAPTAAPPAASATDASQAPAPEASAGTPPPANSAPAAKPPDPATDSDDSPDGEGTAAPGSTTVAPQANVPAAAAASPKPSPVPVQKPVAPKPSLVPATPPASFEDKLVADGENYLYGHGVPQDCQRAQRNLQIGARQSNARAQTLLGAMYATGHCVNRDLPTAYRWFAKALHGDPGNSRVQRDLEVLWNQMTPEERLLAMKNQ